MADDYVSFSTKIDRLSSEDAEWLKKEIALLKVRDGEGGLGFNYEFLKDDLDPDHHRNGMLYVYSMHNAVIEPACTFIQHFLQERRSGGFVQLTWAEYCPIPRAHAFGGGAVFITAKEIKYLIMDAWLDRTHSEFLKENGKGAVHDAG